MKIYYARVSSKEQNLDRQLLQAKKLDITKVFSEKASGKNISGRGEFQKMMNFVREGDEIHVASLDRLGRSYDDIISTINKLQSKKVNIIVEDAPFLRMNSGNELLDKALSDMLVSLLSYIAENERRKIRERQAQGIKIAKEQGKYQGRPKKYSKDSTDPQGKAIYEQAINLMKSGLTPNAVAAKLKLSGSTIMRIAKEYRDSLNNNDDNH